MEQENVFICGRIGVSFGVSVPGDSRPRWGGELVSACELALPV